MGNMFQKRIIALNMTIFLIFSSSINAFPTIISEQGINHTKSKQLVYSIPKVYFRDVDEIIFTNKVFAKCEVIDAFGQKACWKGWASAYWNNKHICTSTRIIMADFNRTRLIHESNHIYDYCVNKANISTEEFANNFLIK